MEHITNGKQTESYSQGWYRERALGSVKPMGDNVWDYSDSLLLYTPGAEESYEEIQQVEAPYYKLVTAPERLYLEDIANGIVGELPGQFTYIDLGPGTEHKEQFIFDAAKEQGKDFTYVPVDISAKFLNLSADYAREQGIEVEPVQLPFEDLADQSPHGVPNFVSIGLTYSNYDPQAILKLLEQIAGNAGYAFISAQIRDRVNMDKLTATYRNDAMGMVMPKIALLGLDPNTDVESTETDSGVQSWCVLKKVTPELERIGLRPGARLLIFQSLRPTREMLEQDIRQVYEEYTLFDDGASSFVGALLKS